MAFGWPAALLGLGAALVPLLIHLLQRGEYRRIDFAATRFLVEHQRLRWRRLKVTQPWLLALRLLLVALCVLLLAEPYTRGPAPARDAGGWTLVSPRVTPSDARALAPPGTELHWLAPGFPSLLQPVPVWQPGANWSLLADADRQLAQGQSLHVIAPGDAAGVSATRPALSRPVQWHQAPAAAPIATQASDLGVDIVVSATRRDDATAVRAAIAAWTDVGLAVTSRVMPDTGDALNATHTLWLSDAPIPGPADHTPRVVVTDQLPVPDDAQVTGFDTDGAPVVLERRAGALTVRYAASGLGTTNPATRDETFAHNLLSLLLGPALSAPPADYPVAASQLAPRVLERATAMQFVRRPWTTTLALLVLAAALVERLASAWTVERRRDA